MPNDTLEATGITKSFGTAMVLNGVDLTVPSGSLTALLGPSGCGKTTFLRVVAGLERPDEGSVSLSGRSLVGPGVFVPPERRRIGMVFQDWALFPHLSVEKNVGYGLGRTERSEGRVAEVLEMVGLAAVAGRSPATLSGGQQQRVAIARALAPHPEVLLLDEPFSNLDHDLRVRIRKEVHDLLSDLGVTTVFVTHDQEEAFVMGSLVAVMRDGRIEQHDSPENLYAKPSSEWIANFVGEANILNATGGGPVGSTAIGSVPLETSATGSIRVLVRPEDLDVTPGESGEISSVEFHGHDTAYSVAVNGLVLRVRSIAQPRFAVGDAVNLRYVGRPARVFEAAPADQNPQAEQAIE